MENRIVERLKELAYAAVELEDLIDDCFFDSDHSDEGRLKMETEAMLIDEQIVETAKGLVCQDHVTGRGILS